MSQLTLIYRLIDFFFSQTTTIEYSKETFCGLENANHHLQKALKMKMMRSKQIWEDWTEEIIANLCGLEERKRWHQSLSKDVYVEEAISVLEDMKINNIRRSKNPLSLKN